jgi:hypothetical protein
MMQALKQWFRLLMIMLLGLGLGKLQAAEVPALVSGQPMPVGTADRIGPLAAGISSIPVGYASLSGGAQPDLFVEAGRFSHDPGLFFYAWDSSNADGTPIFTPAVEIKLPYRDKSKTPPPGVVWQDASKAVHGVWLLKNELGLTQYDHASKSFTEVGRVALAGLPREAENIGLLPNPDGTFEVLLAVPDGVAARPAGPDWRSKDFFPYDGRGIWRGGLPYLGLFAVTLPDLKGGAASAARQITPTLHDIPSVSGSPNPIKLAADRARDILVSSWFGDVYCYRNTAASGLKLGPRQQAIDEQGIVLRHPSCGGRAFPYPNAKTGFTDFVSGGESALYYYQFTGKFSKDGRPMFRRPVPTLVKEALLTAGSLSVPNIVDWDGDGVLDIVAGNSEGRILFFHNGGSDRAPAFVPGVPLQAGGEEICVQPGYKEDIQGPMEARWGYVSPTVVDWNGDGALDIVMSSSNSRHVVYMNRGSAKAPKLEPEHAIYEGGLDLHGSWRVKPGAAKLGGRMAYVCLDDDDQFHLYWRVDDYNLEDGGKLKLEAGMPISANFLQAGGTGRLKMNLIDWDEDGLTDIVTGTPRHASIPEPTKGLPQSLGLPGSSVVFLKNVGTEAQPVYAYPELLKHDGKAIFIGNHEIGVAMGPLGPGKGLNLVVGREDGRLLFYQREHLTPPEQQ